MLRAASSWLHFLTLRLFPLLNSSTVLFPLLSTFPLLPLLSMFVDTFIKRPIWLRVLARDRAGGGAGNSDDADRAVSGCGAANGLGHHRLHRRQRGNGGTAVERRRSSRQSTASKACSTCLVEHQQRREPDQCHVDITRDPDLAAIDVQNRVSQAAGRLPAEVRQTGVTVQKAANNFVLADGVYSAGVVRCAVHLQLPRRLRQGRVEAHSGRGDVQISASASTRCACGSIPCASPPASSRG